MSSQMCIRDRGIDAYIVPTTDFHGSEYVNDYFKCREYISGFTGSAGTLVVTAEDAGLWTDGRYFLQAAQELSGSGIHLMKMNQAATPTIPGYLLSLIHISSIIILVSSPMNLRTSERV